MTRKTIALLEQEVEYTLKTSQRARGLRLAVYSDGQLVVTAPALLSQNAIEEFIKQKSAWVIEKLKFFKSAPPRTIIKAGRNGYTRYKHQTLELIQRRIHHFNSFYQFQFNRITIRKQKSRWASCSKRRNLSFNYKLAFLPAHLSDYIIVHELCHLAELNHSKQFWAQVARVLPDYRKLRAELKRTFVQ